MDSELDRPSWLHYTREKEFLLEKPLQQLYVADVSQSKAGMSTTSRWRCSSITLSRMGNGVILKQGTQVTICLLQYFLHGTNDLASKARWLWDKPLLMMSIPHWTKWLGITREFTVHHWSLTDPCRVKFSRVGVLTMASPVLWRFTFIALD